MGRIVENSLQLRAARMMLIEAWGDPNTPGVGPLQDAAMALFTRLMTLGDGQALGLAQSFMQVLAEGLPYLLAFF